MSKRLLFDTSVLIDHLRTNCHAARLETLTGVLVYSSVVLAELWRGVRTAEEKGLLESFERRGPVLTPAKEEWPDSGRVLAEMKRGRGFETGKLRDLHFDVLIALTARSHGAQLVTSNRADFELIRAYRNFELEVW